MTNIITYPNPFTKWINIRFSNGQAIRQLHVELYDLSGRLQATRSFETMPAGDHQLIIPIQGKQAPVSGVYMLKLVADGKLVDIIKVIKKE